MKAIHITQFGGPEVMQYVDLLDPTPSSGQAVLDVMAIGINYADTHQTENSYLSPQRLPMIPGLEVVGRMPDGTRVLAAGLTGGYCQKTLVDPMSVIPLPDAISDGQALAMMVQGTTAYLMLQRIAHLQTGESVVVHAAAGGVGTLAIQLARHWGARVIAVTSSAEKRELCTRLGADAVVDANVGDLTAALLEANGGYPVDVVLEMVGGTTFDQSLAALAPFGRLVVYGMASRTAPTPVHPGALMPKSQTISGFWLVNAFADRALMQHTFADLFALVLAGTLTPIVGGTYPLSQAATAHRDMLARRTVGKLVLDPTA